MTIADRLAAKAKQELEIIEPLSDKDRKDWKRLREEASIHQDAVCSFAQCLADIRDRRLYREEYGTFDAYVAAELSVSRRHIDRLIHHNEVKSILASHPISGPFGPEITESESRHLKNVPPEKIPGVIKKATAKANSEGRKRTATDVKAIAAKVKPAKPKPEKPAKPLDEQIKAERKKARSYAEYLQRSIDDLNRIKPNKAAHSDLIKWCGQILGGLERW
jgi:hypothetical protein